jgi:hypothetical protein
MYESCDGCCNGFKPAQLTMKFPDGDQLCYCPTCYSKATDNGIPDYWKEPHMVELPPKGDFTLKTHRLGYDTSLLNEYDCQLCLENGVEHIVKTDIPHGFGTTIRKCTGCTRWDGPWVSADLGY